MLAWIKTKCSKLSYFFFSYLQTPESLLTFVLTFLHIQKIISLCLQRKQKSESVIDIHFFLGSGNIMDKEGITENEADESDSLSDDCNYHKTLRRRRSATVSPASGTRFRHHSKSRFHLNLSKWADVISHSLCVKAIVGKKWFSAFLTLTW